MKYGILSNSRQEKRLDCFLYFRTTANPAPEACWTKEIRLTPPSLPPPPPCSKQACRVCVSIIHSPAQVVRESDRWQRVRKVVQSPALPNPRQLAVAQQPVTQTSHEKKFFFKKIEKMSYLAAALAAAAVAALVFRIAADNLRGAWENAPPGENKQRFPSRLA